MLDKMKISGRVLWRLIHADGSEERGETHNLVVTEGLNFIADRLAATPTMTQMGYMILGTGGIAPQAAFTWVQTGFAGNSKALDANYPIVKVGDPNCVQYVSTFGPGVGTANGIDEIVISDKAAAADGTEPADGYILSYALLDPVINKGANDTIVFTWEVTVNAA